MAVGIAGQSATTFDDTTVTGGNTYWYRVNAYKTASLFSGWVYTDSVTTDDGLTLSTSGSKGRKGVKIVDLSWNGTPGVDYSISRNSVVIVPSITGTSHQDTITTKGGGSYTYEVCTVNTPVVCSNESTVVF